MNRYFKYRTWDDLYVYKDNTLYSYTSVSPERPLFKFKSNLTLEDILAAVGHKFGNLVEISETDFLKTIIIRGVSEYD